MFSMEIEKKLTEDCFALEFFTGVCFMVKRQSSLEPVATGLCDLLKVLLTGLWTQDPAQVTMLEKVLSLCLRVTSNFRPSRIGSYESLGLERTNVKQI